jgi:hypothetical protein
VGETAPFIDKITSLNTAITLANENLRQLNIDHTWIPKKGDVSYLSADMLVDTALLACSWVDSHPTRVSAAVNNNLRAAFIQFDFIYTLPLEA